MPRAARAKSETGIYHAIVRGVNKQAIFRENADREKYLAILKECKGISNFNLYAYCLMVNHVHLLIHEGTESIATIFRRTGTRYALWFNKKYGRCGHLFQDRYKSKPVDNNSYFLMLLRYIHRNPVEAGLVKKAAYYGWSSYNEYVDIEYLIDIDFPLSIISIHKKAAIIEFEKLINTDHNSNENIEKLIRPY